MISKVYQQGIIDNAQALPPRPDGPVSRLFPEVRITI